MYIRLRNLRFNNDIVLSADKLTNVKLTYVLYCQILRYNLKVKAAKLQTTYLRKKQVILN